MSLVVEHMKADLILKDILSGKITSLKEVEEKMGEGDYYKLWAKNIWEYHTTEAPSLDLRTQFPSKEKIKQYKLTSDGKYFIVNIYAGNSYEDAYMAALFLILSALFVTEPN